MVGSGGHQSGHGAPALRNRRERGAFHAASATGGNGCWASSETSSEMGRRDGVDGPPVAPPMPDQHGDIAQFQGCEDRQQPRDVRSNVWSGCSAGSSERRSSRSRCGRAEPAVGQHREHRPGRERPGGLAVAQENHGPAVAYAIRNDPSAAPAMVRTRTRSRNRTGRRIFRPEFWNRMK